MFDNFDMGMPLGEKLVFALQVSLFGILMVFLLLIILAVLIMIISRVVRLGENLAGKKGKKNAASDEPAPVQQSAAAGTPLPGTQSQGTLELDGVHHGYSQRRERHPAQQAAVQIHKEERLMRLAANT